jgi:hypothetical protein
MSAQVPQGHGTWKDGQRPVTPERMTGGTRQRQRLQLPGDARPRRGRERTVGDEEAGVLTVNRVEGSALWVERSEVNNAGPQRPDFPEGRRAAGWSRTTFSARSSAFRSSSGTSPVMTRCATSLMRSRWLRA